jgi:hypothetical protein
MADRGDCTFVTKVRHAQHAGASGVLIADNQCVCNGESRNCRGRLLSFPALVVVRQSVVRSFWMSQRVAWCASDGAVEYAQYVTT